MNTQELPKNPQVEDSLTFIAPDGTFLTPDEIEDYKKWRELKNKLYQDDIKTSPK